MEEISAAFAVPFGLGNLIFDESMITTHMDIAGIDLIASSASLLLEPRVIELPSLSIGSENTKFGCNDLETEDSVVANCSEEYVLESGNSWILCETSDQDCKEDDLGSFVHITNFLEKENATLEANSVMNSYANLDIENNIGDLQTFDGSNNELEEIHEKKSCTQRAYKLGSVPLWGSASVCGRRLEMEDAVMILPNFLRIPTQMLQGRLPIPNGRFEDLEYQIGHFFGVYDGHGGSQVANYCRERLHMVLAEELEIVKENSSDYSLENKWQETWEKTFLSCYRKVDAEVGGDHNGNKPTADASEGGLEPVAPDAVGSTAVVAIVSPNRIIVANCGDSRAVLYRGKVAVPLSVDHKPDREDECARIESAGGKVIYWDGYRVSGVLAMSRSIGDRYLEPYVIPDPELMFVTRAKEDECLIIASDGLWDVLTNEEVCDVARRRILLWHKKNGTTTTQPAERSEGGADPAAQDASDYLTRLALHRGSADNISVIVVDLKTQRRVKRKP